MDNRYQPSTIISLAPYEKLIHEIAETIESEKSQKIYRFELEQGAQLEVRLELKTIQGMHSVIVEIILNGRDTQAHVRGTCQVYNEAQLSLITTQIHSTQSTDSELRIHTIVYENAHFKAMSTINISENAALSSARQHHKVILADKYAHASVEPILEVIPHEVQCAHGVAIGPLAEHDLFYLQSRGINKDVAEQILFKAHLTL